MCHPVTCRTCSKTTWSGCGQHAQQVMSKVAPDEHCTCKPAERTVAPSSLLSRILGR